MDREYTDRCVKEISDQQTSAEDELRRRKEKRGRITPARLWTRRKDKGEEYYPCFILEFPFLEKYSWQIAQDFIDQFHQEFGQLIGLGTAVVFKTRATDPFRLSIMMASLCGMKFGWVGLLHTKKKGVNEFRVIRADHEGFSTLESLDLLSYEYELQWDDGNSARNLVYSEFSHYHLIDKLILDEDSGAREDLE